MQGVMTISFDYRALREATARCPPRPGLRIIRHRGDPAVGGALVRYAGWLRKNYDFPVRVPVYLRPGNHLVTRERHIASASFFAPFDLRVEPYIRIATGDYPVLKKQCGRDNALAQYIHSLSHELIHYWQWLETGTTWEAGVVVRATGMLRKYEKCVDHP